MFNFRLQEGPKIKYTSLGSNPPGTCVPSLEQKQFGRTQLFVSHLEAWSASSMTGAGAKTTKKK
jgi:hypothetical protein